MPRKKAQSMSDRPVLRSQEGVSLTMRTEKATGDAYWVARIRIAPYPLKTINEKKYRTGDSDWISARRKFEEDVDQTVEKYYASAGSDRAKRLMYPKGRMKTAVAPPKTDTSIVTKHTLDGIMGCVGDEPLIDPRTGTPKMKTVHLPDGTTEKKPIMHTAVDDDCIFCHTFSNLRYTSLADLRRKYINYIRPRWGNAFIEDITVQDIEDSISAAKNALGQRNLSKIKTVWDRICMIAVRNGWITPDRNPAQQTDQTILAKANQQSADSRRKQTLPEYRRITDDNLRTIITAIRTSNRFSTSTKTGQAVEFRNSVIVHAIVLMRYLGLRPAEAFSLTASNIHLEYDENGKAAGGTLTIDHSMGKREHNERYIRPPKTITGIRTLALMRPAAECLRSAEALSAKREIGSKTRPVFDEAGHKYANEDFVFADINGNLFDVSKIGAFVGTLAKEHGIAFSFYTCRHTLATDLQLPADGQAAPDKAVQAVLGHTDIEMSRYYAQERIQDTADALSIVHEDFTDLLNPDLDQITDK